MVLAIRNNHNDSTAKISKDINMNDNNNHEDHQNDNIINNYNHNDNHIYIYTYIHTRTHTHLVLSFHTSRWIYDTRSIMVTSIKKMPVN